MKRFLFLLLTLVVLLGLQCSVGKFQPREIVLLNIDLSKLSTNYLSLADYQEDTVVIGGNYTGDRLVFKNVRDVVMIFVDCSINSTHAEDALVFADPVYQLEMWAEELTVEGGGITFWSLASNVRLSGGSIRNTHTGIRATQDVPHQNITIENWYIENTTHEGIYLGVSKATDKAGTGFLIQKSTLENSGWDGIQVGNTRHAVMTDNTLRKCGVVNQYGQDYGITVNPGSLAYIYNNTILETEKPIQVLDARVFFHAPITQ